MKPLFHSIHGSQFQGDLGTKKETKKKVFYRIIWEWIIWETIFRILG